MLHDAFMNSIRQISVNKPLTLETNLDDHGAIHKSSKLLIISYKIISKLHQVVIMKFITKDCDEFL